MPKLRCLSTALSLVALALVLTSANSTPAALTGVCPDGSVFIVQTAASIPCKAAKLVEPHEVPPLRPEYLPAPYTWQVYNQTRNPNNPYNLIDAARQIRSMQDQTASGSPEATPEVSSGPPPSETAEASPWAAVGPLDLGLGDQELRDLFQIVQVSQEYVPAFFARDTADGRGLFEVSLAYSAAFEERLREVWASRGGLGGSRVLLFSALSKQPEEFYANFTFVQEHLTFQPDPDNARQLGILQGRLGALGANELVLGYVVLPGQIELASELDIYWNDRRITANFL